MKKGILKVDALQLSGVAKAGTKLHWIEFVREQDGHKIYQGWMWDDKGNPRIVVFYDDQIEWSKDE